jgi:hypothetical protein
MGVGAAILGVLLIIFAGVMIYKSQHEMSREFLFHGRLALQALERAHELEGNARDLGNMRAGALFQEVKANRANEPGGRALTFLQNYATAMHYVEIFPNEMGFCGPHHCQQLYETCTQESKMFDDGFVSSASQCRDIAAEDK